MKTAYESSTVSKEASSVSTDEWLRMEEVISEINEMEQKLGGFSFKWTYEVTNNK